MANKKPVHQLKAKGINVAIWENGSGDRPRYNATLKRRYQDENGEWHDTDSLGRGDMPLASKLLEMAFAWICEQEGHARSAEASQ